MTKRNKKRGTKKKQSFLINCTLYFDLSDFSQNMVHRWVLITCSKKSDIKIHLRFIWDKSDDQSTTPKFSFFASLYSNIISFLVVWYLLVHHLEICVSCKKNIMENSEQISRKTMSLYSWSWVLNRRWQSWPFLDIQSYSMYVSMYHSTNTMYYTSTSSNTWCIMLFLLAAMPFLAF